MLTLEKQNQLREAYRKNHPEWQPATAVYADLVRERLMPASTLLDLGCGRGGLVEQLGHPLAQTMGVDPDLLSLIEHRMPAFPRAVAFSHQLPLPTASVDVVISAWVLEHLGTPQIDLTEISRVLRPGGAFIFMTPNCRHLLLRLNRLVGRLSGLQAKLVPWLYGRAADDTFPAYYRANRVEDLRRLGENAGMSLPTIHIIPDPTYWAAMPAIYALMLRLDQYIKPENQVHIVGCFFKE